MYFNRALHANQYSQKTAYGGIKLFQAIYQEINNASNRWANEEEVRHDWLRHLENGLNIQFNAERGRTDAKYNQVIIEFKAPGSFYGRDNSPFFREAIDNRLARYIPDQAQKEGIDETEYIGIAIDGYHIAFARYESGRIIYGDLMPLCRESINMVCLALSNSNWRALTAENLIEDFGLSSTTGIRTLQALADFLGSCLSATAPNKVQMMFEEWRTFFGQVSNLSIQQVQTAGRDIRFSIEVSPENELSAKLFTIHTYNSLLIKLLAAEILSQYELTSYNDFAEFSACQEIDSLCKILHKDIELGELFSTAGINRFVDEVIFSWYLDARSTHPEVFHSIKDVLSRLSIYRMDTIKRVGPGDLLKNLYQGLVSDPLRKGLGEFYTPDWLIDLTIERANIADIMGTRVLDPTCGSGTCLLHIIRMKRDAAKALGMLDSEILEHIVNNVWGFDLNPLAVQSARVNYLIAIIDIIRDCPGQHFEIPILLADAVYSPSPNLGKDARVVEYQIGSATADLTITLPVDLVQDKVRLDDILELLSEMVEEGCSYEHLETRMLSRRLATLEMCESWKEILMNTYNRVLDLHRRNWNGIWFRIARNFFRSSVAGEFDLVIGNPPWVRWSNLPVAYRSRINPTCRRYDIFSETSYHGGNELDISGMILYTTADKWLKENGKLAFIITQTHFQSPSSSGFRSFSLDSGHTLLPISVDDLKKIQPFPGVTNKTAVLVINKVIGQTITYPITYRVWNIREEYSGRIEPNLTYRDVLEHVKIEDLVAAPITTDKSPWAILPPGRLNGLRRLIGEGKLVGRKGVMTDLNGVYMVEVTGVNDTIKRVQIKTRPEAGRNDIGQARQFWVEPDLLYPLLKGAADFSMCYTQPANNLYVIVPNLGIRREHFTHMETEIEGNLPLTRRFFQTYREKLEQRSTYRTRLSRAPFYSIYDVGEYTFSPYKVVWAEQSSRFKAAVVESGVVPILGERAYVPDHKVYFVSFEDRCSAYFLCGLLTSRSVRELIESHTISIQVGNIFRYLTLPQFDNQNQMHIELADLTIEAHKITDSIERQKYINSCSRIADAILFDEKSDSIIKEKSNNQMNI